MPNWLKKGLHIQFVDLHFPKLAVYFGNDLTSFRLTGNEFHFIKYRHSIFACLILYMLALLKGRVL